MNRASGTIFRHRVVLPMLFAGVPVAILASSGHCSNGKVVERAYWQQRVEYTIDVVLNNRTHHLIGHETLVYHNNSPDTLKTLYYHLYLNAFRPGSLMDRRDCAFGNYRIARLMPRDQGWTEVKSLTLFDGTPCDFRVDDTILTMMLPRPLAPGRSIRLEMEFESQIPVLIRRTGRQGRRYSLGQWYPKIAVYDHLGWHADPYLGNEFYGDFGSFDVSITLPEEYVVGATGDLVNPAEVMQVASVNGADSLSYRDAVEAVLQDTSAFDSVRTWRFRQDNVHDFAWVADPNYVLEDTTWNGITINLLFVPEVRRSWAKMREGAAQAMAYYCEHVGRYPYKQFTLAQAGEGGMEYPNLIMLRGFDSLPALVATMVHEMGHNWFYGLLGNNETREAWLDEGMTTFYEIRILEHLFGRYGNMSEATSWYEKRFAREENDRDDVFRTYLTFAKFGYEQPILTPSDDFRESSSYVQAVYYKAASVMFMLEYVLGEDVFQRVMKSYFDEWHFRHPYTADFQRVAERVSGRELDWFFDQWLTTTKTCDYAVESLGGHWVERADTSAVRRADTRAVRQEGQRVYQSRVELENKGEIIMPIDLELTLADGSKQMVLIPVDEFCKTVPGARVLRSWAPVDRKYVAVVELPQKAIKAEIDPSLRLQDVNRLNNTSGFLPKMTWRLRLPEDRPYPIDAYLVEYRPSVWYNDEDRARLGIVLQGRYGLEDHKLYFGTWVGAANAKVNYDVQYSHPVSWLGRLTTIHARSFRLEGHRGGALGLYRKIRPRYLQRPPFHDVLLGLRFDRVYDSTYLFDPGAWNRGTVSRALVAYSFDSGARNPWTAKLVLSTDFFGSDFHFHKLSLELKKDFALPLGLALRTRAYGGYASEDVPLQDQFYLAGASPREEFDSIFFRSRGTLPNAWRRNGHLHLGGGGNLRGYLDQNQRGTRLTALNAEFGMRNPWNLLPMRVPVIANLGTRLFADVGAVWKRGEVVHVKNFARGLKADAGFGLQYRLPFPRWMGSYLIRADFPVWVSHARMGQKRFAFQWMIGIGEAF